MYMNITDTGLSSCGFCSATSPLVLSSTRCAACVGSLCPLGANASIFVKTRYNLPNNDPSTWQIALTSPQPLDTIRDQSQTAFASLQLLVGSVIIGVIVICLSVGVFVLRQDIRDCVIYGWSLTNLDLLFRLQHFTPAGEYVVANKSCLGTVLTVMTSVLVTLVGVVLVYQNTNVVAPVSTVATSSLEFEPVGIFQVQVIVVGFGLDVACSLGKITLTLDDPSTIDGNPDVTTVTYVPSDSACQLTWRCPLCRLSTVCAGGQMPSFSVLTAEGTPAWANFYFYNVTMPVMVTSSGSVFTPNPTPLSVSQLMFPTNNPRERVAFRAALAKQAVTVLLTGSTITDFRTRGDRVTYASYQPSILSVSKYLQAGNSSNYMTDASPITVATGQPAGFQLTIAFQRNTVIVLKYAWFMIFFVTQRS
jgi:hypothetical protein